MRRFTFTNVILAVIVGIAACHEDALGPREPVNSVAPTSAPSGVIELKFREGLQVRIIGGELRSGAGKPLDAFQRVFAAHGKPGISPLITLPTSDLDQLSRQAREHSGRAAPDLASWYRVTTLPGADLNALLRDLRALPEVEAAYPAPIPAPPPVGPQLLATNLLVLLTADYSSRQTYFGTAPQGTEAEFARTQPGGRGQGIKIIDLEYDWYFEHEDLGLSSAILLGGARYTGFGNDHGTAVLGELVARDNGFGVTGGVPDAVPRAVAPHVGGFYNPASAVAIAASNMKAGDVLLLEQQTTGPSGTYVPIEWITSVYDAILTATLTGKVVVEAAGNGGQSLDAPEFDGRFNRQLFNSGAIIVGAGNQQHAALGFSDYGSRVDLQGWGTSVTTTGYGQLSGSSTATQADDYTASFSGTSSASPIVAAAVAALEGNAKATGRPVLSPDGVRSLLQRTGSPQTGDVTRPIGPFPNLRAALGPVAVNWATRAAMPAARHQLTVSAAGGRLYAIGGLNSVGTAQRGVFAYNPTSNSWSTKALLPVARYSGNGAAAISGKIYVAGGFDLTKKPTRTLYVYNSATNTWATKAAMPVASGCGGSAVISGKLYVFTGCTLLSTGAQVNVGLLHRYDPATNTWTALRAAPQAHFRPVVAMIGSSLYVVGGDGSSGVRTGQLDVYNPSTNTWTTRAPMPTVRTAAAGAAVGGLLYVAGGFNGTSYLGSFEAYNPATNSWSSRAPMPTTRAALGASLIGTDGRIYAVGGRNASSVLATNERYTP